MAVDGEAQSRAAYITGKAPYYEIIDRESLEWANRARAGGDVFCAVRRSKEAAY